MQLLLLLNVPIQRRELLLHIKKYTLNQISLLDIMKDLTAWNVAHVACEIEMFLDVPVPSPIIFQSLNKHHFYLLISVSGERCVIYNPAIDATIETDFRVFCDNVFIHGILCQKTILSKYDGILPHTRQNWRKLLCQCLMIALISLPVSNAIFRDTGVNPYLTIVGILSVGGLYLCIAISDVAMGKANGLSTFVCGEDDDCSEVLNSRYNNIGGLKLSTIGLMYFSFILYISIYLLASQGHIESTKVSLYMILSISTVAMAPLLYIQVIVVKKLCLLCCSVSAVALSQFLLIGLDTFHVLIVPGKEALYMFILAITSALLLETISESEHSISRLRSQVLTFSSSSSLFTSLSAPGTTVNFDKPNVSTDRHELFVNCSEFVLSPVVEITISPSCPYCEDFLNRLIELTIISDDYLLSLKVQFPSNREHLALDVIIDKYTKTDQASAVNLAYVKNRETVISDSGMQLLKRGFEKEVLLAIKPTINSAYFPRVVVNGRELPMIYSPEQLKSHLVLAKYY